jgi:hypothetical protein
MSSARLACGQVQRLSILRVVGTLIGLLINEIMDGISDSSWSSAFAQLWRDK